jgi:hypothetical protein
VADDPLFGRVDAASGELSECRIDVCFIARTKDIDLLTAGVRRRPRA